MAEGNVGLLKAALRFKPARGVRFMTCAVWWIRKSIREALDRNNFLVRIPDNRLRAIRLLKSAAGRPSGHSENGIDPNDLPRRMRLTSPEVEVLLSLTKQPVRLDPGERQEDEGRPLDCLADAQAHDPRETFERQEASARILGMLEHLTPGERVVLEHRYGLKDDEPRTLQEIGHELGGARDRVHQAEGKARKRLRRFL